MISSIGVTRQIGPRFERFLFLCGIFGVVSCISDSALWFSPAYAQEASSQEGKDDVTERGIKLYRTDATPAISGKTFPDGFHIVSRDQAGYALQIAVRGGKIVEYYVQDPVGNSMKSIFETILEGATTGVKPTTTCWSCYTDKSGNKHCFKISCPDIPQ